ncbi:lipopolysaccharide biosynthesis protein [Actinomyces polynesiensis]|uniref:lipopolysaccharide biosynthesis protein n=1 Tax=Actinomyces polynesiensis TaxID=1325934 RepID=UPI00164D8717|nr:oligosaccharide flippase family protein [Actinomyces polynesiensis]
MLLLNVVLARLAKPQDVAAFLVVLTLSTIISGAFSIGLERVGVVVLKNQRADTLVATGVQILRIGLRTSLLAGLVGAAVATLGGLVSPSRPVTVVLVMLFLFLENLRIVYGDLPRTWGRADLVLLSGPALPRLLLLCVVSVSGYFHRDFSLDFLLVILCAGTVVSVAAGVSATFVLARGKRTWSTVGGSSGIGSVGESGLDSVPSLRFLLKEGMPLAVANVALAALNQADTLIVAVFFDPSTVAAYAVVSRLANLFGNVRTMINASMVPFLSKRPGSIAEGDSQLRLARLATSCLFYSCVPLVVAAAFGFEPLITWLYGQSYSLAAEAGLLLLVGQIVSIGSGFSGTLLLRDGDQKIIMFTQVGTAAVTCALMVLVARFGSITMIGLVSAGGTASCAVVMSLVYARRRDVHVWALGPGRTLRGLMSI